jgi:hypothetical protein
MLKPIALLERAMALLEDERRLLRECQDDEADFIARGGLSEKVRHVAE